MPDSTNKTTKPTDPVHIHDLELDIELPKTHHLSNDIAVHAVPVPDPEIAVHTRDLLKFKLRLNQNEITSISGALAGFIAGVVVCPLDVAKTRFQAQGTLHKYTGPLQALEKIWSEEGIRGLYRGIVPITCGYFPTWMIYFTCYERFKKIYSINLNLNDNLSYFASAISSGIISSTLTNPIWVVKTRLMLQMDNGKSLLNNTYYNGTFDAFRKMYKLEGLKVFYQGLLPSYFGLAHVAIQFPLYENFKRLLNISNNELIVMNDESNKLNNFLKFILASSLSKMIASSITYPHEILRTRLQLANDNPAYKNENQFRSLIRVCKSIIKLEGFKGFYSGFLINLARTVPASAVTMVSFEYFREYFQRFSI
ncbi:hypothetical protein CANINC_000660 [Pichia inconspicua]|uniref:Mitochondrial thiamine pyrophosphate carrier 1 n=1 Tax=Pichia inconspicua TaxID=52247 RepID=A0A4T0X7A0_9ASCO|nr:hypothetical protein CANINC_000660 [[Candida] inconspicua]